MSQQPPEPPKERTGPRTGPITGPIAVVSGIVGPRLTVRRAAFIVVLAMVAGSVLLTVLVGFRSGGFLLAAASLTGAAARAFLPEYLCLGLLVRSRRQDVATLLLLGVALAASAQSVPR